jgi:hypothetical protein
MLYKNDEIYKLVPNGSEIKEIEKFFHNKFPVKVIYPPDRVVPSNLPHNRLPDKPNSISFDLTATVKTPSGAETWRYATNVIIEPTGRKKYVPKKFKFAGSRFLDRDDIELIFFLLKKSTSRLLSEDELKKDKTLKQPNRPKFMFEDLVSEAEKKAEKRALEIKIGSMLYGDYALPDARIKEIAKAYHISDVDTYSLAQIKDFIERKIHAEKDGADTFFEMVGDEESMKIRVSIQGVVDMKMLEHDLIRNAWYWKTKTGKEPVKGGNVPPNKTPMDALYDLYVGNDRFKEDLQAVLISRTPKTDKASKKVLVGADSNENEDA